MVFNTIVYGYTVPYNVRCLVMWFKSIYTVTCTHVQVNPLLTQVLLLVPMHSTELVLDRSISTMLVVEGSSLLCFSATSTLTLGTVLTVKMLE